MKIGILTFHHALNCGALLQAWALQAYLQGQGYAAEIVNYRKIGWNRLFTFNAGSMRSVVRSVRTVFRTIAVNIMPELSRRRLFLRFLNERMGIGQPVARDELASLAYSHWICGSDQIWNPLFNGNDDAYFLEFVPEGKRRIAYGPSFGIRQFDAVTARRIGVLLSRFDRISVRERTGAALVRELCGKSAQMVCDPTLLMPAAAYEGLEREPRARLPAHYVAVYLVGRHPWALSLSKRVARGRRLPVVLLQGGEMARWETNGTVRKISVLGPSEWLSFIHRADYLVTNSFHGTVFALQYHVPFVVTENGTAGDERMATLLDSVGLADRAASHVDADISDAVDWSSVDGCVERMRSSGCEYLNEALS